MIRERIVSAVVGAVVGVLVTGFASMLTVGDRLHALELSLRKEIAEVREDMAKVQTAMELIKREVRP